MRILFWNLAPQKATGIVWQSFSEYLPEAELITKYSGIIVGEIITAMCPPVSIVKHFQSSFVWHTASC